MIGNEDTRERVERLEVGDRVDSDHHPVVIWVKGGGREEGGTGKIGAGRNERRGNWTQEGRVEFMRSFGIREVRKRGVEEEWGELSGRIKEAVNKMGKGEKKGGWWDEECREEKGKVRRELRRWRREGGMGVYIGQGKENTESCVRKKKRWRGGKRK